MKRSQLESREQMTYAEPERRVEVIRSKVRVTAKTYTNIFHVYYFSQRSQKLYHELRNKNVQRKLNAALSAVNAVTRVAVIVMDMVTTPNTLTTAMEEVGF